MRILVRNSLNPISFPPIPLKFKGIKKSKGKGLPIHSIPSYLNSQTKERPFHSLQLKFTNKGMEGIFLKKKLFIPFLSIPFPSPKRVCKG
jgi:hypothetical protein